MAINLILEKEAFSSNHKIYGVNKQGARYQYKKEREKFETSIKNILGVGNELNRKAFKIVRHWGKGKRKFDEANLVGGFKILIDAFVNTGHLKDDNPDYFKGYYFQKKSETGLAFIEVIELNPFEELVAFCEKGAETFIVDPDTLLRAAKQTQLIRI